jgi:uncharacterized membrane protein YedE/YeeE
MPLARCPWYIAGPLIGLVIVALRATVNRPLGMLGGYVEAIERLRSPRYWGVPVFLVIGTLIGGFLFAVTTGSFAPDFRYGIGLLSADSVGGIAAIVAAGIIMGFGARIAGGCTSGHGLCGTSLGSPASFASTVTFFAVAVLAAHALQWLYGGL